MPRRWKAVTSEPDHVRFELPSGGSLEYWREGHLMKVELSVPRPGGKAHHESFPLKRRC